MMSYYFVTTTITTVGYGDISASNVGERIFSILLLLGGVATFAYASGQMSSIMTNYDSSQVLLKQKLMSLEHLRVKYKLPEALVKEVKTSLIVEYNRRIEGLGEFLEELPHNLKYKLGNAIHGEMLGNFKMILKVNEKSFVSWLGHRLFERLILAKHYLYQETEEM